MNRAIFLIETIWLSESHRLCICVRNDISNLSIYRIRQICANSKNNNKKKSTFQPIQYDVGTPEINFFLLFSYVSLQHSLLAGRIPIESVTGPIKRGLLWQQRDRLFSRWKER